MQTFKIFSDIDFSDMQLIKGGAFMMGTEDGYSDETPVHQVKINDFYIGKYPVTQALWQQVMGNNPSRFKGKNRPVEQVSWNDIKNDFLPKLNELTSFDGKFRLPTEAEWEYAAKTNQNYKYAGSNDLEEVGWYRENSHMETNPVGLKNPNNFGLYDMSGNVWEWCEDQWHNSYENAPTDGSAWIDDAADDSLSRVLRGGSYFFNAAYCRSSYRNYIRPAFRDNYVGFRLVFQVQ